MSSKILWYNYADPDIYANVLESSAQASFPVTNLMAKIRRSKVWRSGGYYNVSSSNNTLVFRDVSGGSDKTATIAVGEYTTTASFVAAVDAALEAAGSANYTVTQNTTSLKFVLTSDLSGGATHFELNFAHASNTCEDLLGFASTHFTGASTYTADYIRITTGERITFDLGIPANPIDFAMTGARNRALKLSPNGTFKIQGSSTNAWTTPEYTATLTYDDEVLIQLSEEGLHTSNLRYWSVSLDDKENPYGYLELGAFFLGDSWPASDSRGKAQFPMSSSLFDRSSTVTSEGGQTLSEVLEKSQIFTVDWNGLTKSEIETLLDIFQDYGTSSPFFICLDSDANFSSTANRQVRYVKFSDEPSFTLVSPNNFKAQTKFKEEL